MTAADLVFTPHDEEPPEDGEVLELEVANPNYAAERAAHEAVLARNPFAKSYARATFRPRLTQSPNELVDANDLCLEHARVTLVVGYPFEGTYAVPITAPTPLGFTRADLFTEIVRVHTAMYDAATQRPMEGLLNTLVESPRFGEAHHRIEDLVLEGITVQPRPGAQPYAWVTLGS